MKARVSRDLRLSVRRNRSNCYALVSSLGAAGRCAVAGQALVAGVVVTRRHCRPPLDDCSYSLRREGEGEREGGRGVQCNCLLHAAHSSDIETEADRVMSTSI